MRREREPWHACDINVKRRLAALGRAAWKLRQTVPTARHAPPTAARGPAALMRRYLRRPSAASGAAAPSRRRGISSAFGAALNVIKGRRNSPRPYHITQKRPIRRGDRP